MRLRLQPQEVDSGLEGDEGDLGEDEVAAGSQADDGQRARAANEPVAYVDTEAIAHLPVDYDLAGAGRALAGDDLERSAQPDLWVIPHELDVKVAFGRIARAVHLKGPDDERAHRFDLRQQAELSAGALRQDGRRLDEVGGAFAGYPQIGRNDLDVLAHLLAPTSEE